ncbi:hypothetical protein MBAV_003941 [Candidatus Magnetobacterium bavaricum]|uniref:Uncharacterized protein n=1 Tax=Candidatus Magnetobacterium bavaricum TaxID=29290 RepID=A0A0F3GT59_9BACT|nr:hypothetical protein MBAV_003941 [Candidatus Magnetobacterium bavaricum]
MEGFIDMERVYVNKSRMGFYRLVLLAVVLVFGWTLTAWGKDNPTKKETIAFIQEKCDNLKITEDVTSRVYPDENDDCTFIVKITGAQSYRKYIVPLKEMDPGAIKNGFDTSLGMYTDFINIGVILTSREDKKEKTKPVKAITVSYDDKKQERKTEENHEDVTFTCNTERSAEKVGRAMSHLIVLCGGKADLF